MTLHRRRRRRRGHLRLLRGNAGQKRGSLLRRDDRRFDIVGGYCGDRPRHRYRYRRLVSACRAVGCRL